MKVGFIGLGTMGGSMALNAIKGGHQLTVYDVRREVAKPHLQEGAAWGEGPRAVAEVSDIVLTSLPGPKEAEAVGEELIESSMCLYFSNTALSPPTSSASLPDFAPAGPPETGASSIGMPFSLNFA